MKSIYPVLIAAAFITSACGPQNSSQSTLKDDNDLPSRKLSGIEHFHPFAKFKPEDVVVIKLVEVDAGNCKDLCGSNEFRVTVGISKNSFNGPFDLVLNRFHVGNLDNLRRRSFLEDDTAQSVFKINIGSLNAKISQMMGGANSLDYERLHLSILLQEVDPISNDLNVTYSKPLIVYNTSSLRPANYSQKLEVIVREEFYEASAEVALSIEEAVTKDEKNSK